MHLELIVLPPRLEIIIADSTGIHPFLNKSLVKLLSLAILIQYGTIKTKYMASKIIGQIICGIRIESYKFNEWIVLEVWAKMAKVTRSPKLAAMGVATLSGLMSSLLDALKR